MKNKILTVIQLVLIIILIFSMYKIYNWFNDNQETQKNLDIIEKHVEEVIVEDNDEEKTIIQVDFNALKTINPNTSAYLKVNNTNIEYPVVQTTDNEYYLNRTFNDSINNAGWIFADYKNKLDGTDKNLIIYGHARENGSMFGTLKDTLSSDWYNNLSNRVITIITETNYYTYEIFSIYTIENEEYYITTDFINEDFTSFIEIIKERSVHDFNIPVNNNDQVLTLSTCYQGDANRMVVHAKMISNEIINNIS